jgi:hypothetical protein
MTILETVKFSCLDKAPTAAENGLLDELGMYS